jgi:hypothetical protein
MDNIANFASSNYADVPIVLVNKIVPASLQLPELLISRIDVGDDAQLWNLFSLVGREVVPISTAKRPGYDFLVVDDNETNLQSAKIALES